MTNSYNNEKKTCFLKRMWNNIFHKTLVLDAAIEYTQKEIKTKSDDIIEHIKYRY